MSINTYYVYAYVRNKDSKTAKAGTPYYIGKGKKKRAWSKHHGFIPVPKNSNNIVILESNLTELGAFALERRLIRWYGRIDNKTGILRNRTNGGDGGPGARKGRPSPTRGMKAWNRGIEMSEEAKRKASAKLKNRIPWNKGIPVTEESNRKRKLKQSGITKPQITCPHCGKVGGKPVMMRHHYDKCKKQPIIFT